MPVFFQQLNSLESERGYGNWPQHKCIVTEATITSQLKNVEFQSILGTPDYVFGIMFRKSFMHCFPRGLHQSFPNLLRLEINGCGLKVLNGIDLIGLEQLVSINLDSNNLRSLPSDLFVDMTSLKEISFEDNQLEFLRSDLLKQIEKNELTFVNFRNNTNIDEFFKAGESVLSLGDLMEIIDDKCSDLDEDDDDVNKLMNKRKSFKDLWVTGHLSDFAIVAGEETQQKTFSVHKCVLGIQSEFFATMFENEMKETQTGEMTINDYSADAVEDFLRFFYIGAIPNDNNAVELFKLASLYDVVKLKSAAEKIIARSINDENAIEILKFAKLFSSENLKQIAFKNIQCFF